ncbi:inositol monophosphatase family protein [Pedobacter sp. SYSU D00535]|uniref:inositol monophosphatase family protein n=1 Tax=Pedobacter sp. SYSU D00535 TaxID=2810308 RepID=UPI001A963F8E|nr:inositol monophosphatase family protein [Pedobacter sp. SYSU D00535]
MNLEHLTKEVIELAKEVGGFIRNEAANFSGDSIEFKGYNNLVSYVDKTAEEKIVARLSELLPEAGYITEEETINKTGEVYNWIVDPLDGTTNFIHGLPIFSVSIALEQNKELVLGVVYEINLDECFYAWKDGGSYVNGKPIKVTAHTELSQTLLATGFPYFNFEKENQYLNVVRELMQKCHGIRRMGSAAVDMAYVACGRFDGYFEYNINLYDIAAGVVIVREAGGSAFNFSGEDEFFQSREVIASNGKVGEAMKEVIQRNFQS